LTIHFQVEHTLCDYSQLKYISKLSKIAISCYKSNNIYKLYTFYLFVPILIALPLWVSEKLWRKLNLCVRDINLRRNKKKPFFYNCSWFICAEKCWDGEKSSLDFLVRRMTLHIFDRQTHTSLLRLVMNAIRLKQLI
jgi:hypothetical protein